MLLLGIMMGLTLRSKALGAAVIIALLYTCVYFWKKKLNLEDADRMYSGFTDRWRISDLLLLFQQSSKRICKISADD